MLGPAMIDGLSVHLSATKRLFVAMVINRRKDISIISRAAIILAWLGMLALLVQQTYFEGRAAGIAGRLCAGLVCKGAASSIMPGPSFTRGAG